MDDVDRLFVAAFFVVALVDALLLFESGQHCGGLPWHVCGGRLSDATPMAAWKWLAIGVLTVLSVVLWGVPVYRSAHR